MVFITSSLRYSSVAKNLTTLLFNKYISNNEKINANNLYMNPEQLNILSRLNNILIGGHGSNSDILTKTDLLDEEINESFNMLKSLGIKEMYFSYPNGMYDNKVLKKLKDKGFKKCFSTSYYCTKIKNNKNFKII